MYVISLGGSVIFNEHGINTPYYSSLVELIKGSKERHIFVVGGGNLAREYIEAARNLGITQSDSLDSLGVHATHLNALLFHYALLQAGVTSYHARYMDEVPDILLEPNKTVVTGGGPLGQTTDMVGIRCCQRFALSSMINVTNVGKIYDRNPSEEDAIYLPSVNASDLIGMWGTEHVPGLNRPFEPRAIAEALKSHITIHVIGPDIGDLRNVIEGKKHSGTVILPE